MRGSKLQEAISACRSRDQKQSLQFFPLIRWRGSFPADQGWRASCGARSCARGIYRSPSQIGDVASTAVNRASTILSLLATVLALAAFVAGLWIFAYIVAERRYWNFRDFVGSVYLLCLPLAVLLTSFSVYLLAESAREQLTALPPPPGTPAAAAPAENEGSQPNQRMKP